MFEVDQPRCAATAWAAACERVVGQVGGERLALVVGSSKTMPLWAAADCAMAQLPRVMPSGTTMTLPSR